ncbi:carbon starvation protein A [Ignicoccus hospitalis]|uniref:Carbon starvation protein CstA n=1 Tax=Ignicoccus hospitalis (strain KIN4/I / DSM 18386 / JCM 14125) TaxID=453591 RepID=A8AC48_IGNH4|nr:carbon starvation protein A [Ignicoccus hospitalis]ABU82500.1 carbon starvation protein CstA [Ignicoccus hospitalis KIN4/I]
MITTTLLVVIALIIYAVTYQLYGRRILERKVVKASPEREVPARKFLDNVDYVPTNKYVLMGHHFASIAGAGPIVGPAMAMGWGWLMPILWIWFGNVFVGAVHDYLSLMASVRYDGRSIQWISGRLISKSMSRAFSVFIYFALLLVIAAFGAVIGHLFVKIPMVATASMTQIALAVLLGYLMYQKSLKPVQSAAVAVVLILISILIAENFPIKLSYNDWVAVLLVYTIIAASLPVWVLLQPRDFMNSLLLYFGLALGVVGLIALFGELKVPAYTSFDAPVLGVNSPFWPLVPLVIACGALSGFHSLVASGTTSKQLDNELSGLLVGYGSMFAEGLLSTLVVASIAAMLPLMLLNPQAYGLKLSLSPDVIQKALADPVEFGKNYPAIMKAFGGPAGIFSKSFGAAVGTALHLPVTTLSLFAGLWITSFALTTLDTTVRLARFTWSELVEELKVGKKVLSNAWVSSLVAAVLGFSLALSGAYLVLWPAFSGVNQMLASIAMMTVAAWVIKDLKAPKRYQLTVLAPAAFLWITVTLALILYVAYIAPATIAAKGSVTLAAVEAITIIELIFNFYLLKEFLNMMRKEGAKQVVEVKTSV